METIDYLDAEEEDGEEGNDLVYETFVTKYMKQNRPVIINNYIRFFWNHSHDITGDLWCLHSSDTGSIQHGHQSDQERHNELDQSSDGNYDCQFYQTICIYSRHHSRSQNFCLHSKVVI